MLVHQAMARLAVIQMLYFKRIKRMYFPQQCEMLHSFPQHAAEVLPPVCGQRDEGPVHKLKRRAVTVVSHAEHHEQAMTKDCWQQPLAHDAKGEF